MSDTYWFMDDRKNIYTKWMGLRLSDETIKQLSAYEDSLSVSSGSGVMDFLYKVAFICRDLNDHDRAIRVLLSSNHISLYQLKGFLEKCETLNITGNRFQSQLNEFTIHRDLNLVSIAKISNYSDIISNVINENTEKIKTSENLDKLENWLVGQIMKNIEDKRSVDVAEIKTHVRDRVKTMR